ncbi:MAG: glycosyltransferase [Muribaculaceae bacterium]|nr:glycosyltransferase [Muribaculaceae bacterium]
MNEKPLVSIIIPIYNKQKYVNKCLQSLLAQTCQDFEIIIVDDCSTDSSLSKARHLLRERDRVKIIENESNVGHLKSRYRGISEVSGKYTMFMDADDWMEVRAVEEMVNLMQTLDVDLVQMRTQRRVRGIALKYKEVYDPTLSNRRIDGDEFRTLATYVGMDSFIYPSCCAKLYVTRKLREVAQMEFNQFWGEDQIFNIQYLRESRSMAFSDYIGYNYRWGGITCQYKYSALKEYKNVHQLKRMLGQDEECINDEIKLLLRYHVRSLITELGYTFEAVEMILEEELRDPLWKHVGLNMTAPELINDEYTEIQHAHLKYMAKRFLK